MRRHSFLAIDIGATSGRAVLALYDGKSFEYKEIHRFPNNIVVILGKYCWDIFSLYTAIIESLRICVRDGIRPDSIGIDTWGVDFGFLYPDGNLAGLPRAYRDPYTTGAPEEFFKVHIPKAGLYSKSGIQIMDFNSIFQLYVQKKEKYSPLLSASDILFIPDLLSYMLTGNKVCEYTIASTSQLMNPWTRDLDNELIEASGCRREMFGKVVMPGTVIGTLADGIARSTGIGPVKVVAVAGHDTASAVAAVPAGNMGFAYLSSGTWSLMGIETGSPVISEDTFRYNFTNEGGVEGTFRLLKNITGMWLLEQSRKEWKLQGKDYSYNDIVKMAYEGKGFRTVINPDDPRLSNPADMREAIAALCIEKDGKAPGSDPEMVYCIFRSLACRYREVLENLKNLSPHDIGCLHIIGGGAMNELLNRMTADETGTVVLAGPSEATSIGNCMVQAQAAGIVSDRWEYRRLIAESANIKKYMPGKIHE